MIIKALNTFGGILDLSALERLQESNPYEKEPFRLYIRPGDVVEVDDKFYTLTRIQDALSLGYIEIGNIVTAPEQNNLLVDPSFSGVTMSQIAGENLSFGDVVYYGSDEKVYKAKADSLSTMIGIGITTAATTAGQSAIILVDGMIRSSSVFNFVAGGQPSSLTSIVYVGATVAGGVTQDIPDAFPNIVQIIGYASTTNILVFRPDYTYIEMAQKVNDSSSSSIDSSLSSSIDSSSSSSSSSSSELYSSSSSSSSSSLSSSSSSSSELYSSSSSSISSSSSSSNSSSSSSS